MKESGVDFSDFASDFISKTKRDIIDQAIRIAQQAYQQAIQRTGYQDQTGRLRTSTGWVVYDGLRIVARGGKHYGGNHNGEGLVEDVIIEERPIGDCVRYVLFVAAPYATYVEAKGRDVTTAGELLMEELSDELWQ